MDPTVATLEGTCIICERVIAVRGSLLVHHGYRRPGVGYIVGDCFGVNRPAHEESLACADDWREHCARALEGCREYLERLQRNEVEILCRNEKVPVPTTARRPFDGWWRFKDPDPGFTEWPAPYTNEEPHGTRAIIFDQLRANATSQTKGRIAFYAAEVTRMQAAITSWTRKDLNARLPKVPRVTRRMRIALARELQRKASEGKIKP